MRETMEEIGIDLSCSDYEYLGSLDDIQVMNLDHSLTPVVFLLDTSVSTKSFMDNIKLNKSEGTINTAHTFFT